MSGWALSAADVGPLGALVAALVALAGALAIHFLRRTPAAVPRSPKADVQAEASAQPEDSEIAARLRQIAALMRLPERVLPRSCPPCGDGDFVWREGTGYRYQSVERGVPVVDLSGSSLDEVLFGVFRDRTRMHAYLATIGIDEPGREVEIVRQQRAMLAAGDATWAERLQEGEA